MILLHRITTFVIAACTAGVFGILFYAPHAFATALLIGCLLVPLLFARLLKWEVKRFVFWVFLSLPFFLMASALLFFFFLESDLLKIALGVVVVLVLWMYAEGVFTFYHLPASYQAYTLEYLSLIISILSAFFFTSGLYAMGLFLSLPIWIPALAVLLFVFFISLVVLWVSKIAVPMAVRFATVGAVLSVEVYSVFSLLPTSFLSNAAGFAVFLYVFLGLSRAQALETLSKTVLVRYLSIGAMLLLIIFASARWI